eukprot:318326-Chlamydomonas_euryale.AAC.1
MRRCTLHAPPGWCGVPGGSVFLCASTFFGGHAPSAAHCMHPQVDVEGWEWSVFRGASTLFDRHPVHNIVMEYSP